MASQATIRELGRETAESLSKAHAADVRRLWAIDPESAIKHWRETKARIAVAETGNGGSIRITGGNCGSARTRCATVNRSNQTNRCPETARRRREQKQAGHLRRLERIRRLIAICRKTGNGYPQNYDDFRECAKQAVKEGLYKHDNAHGNFVLKAEYLRKIWNQRRFWLSPEAETRLRCGGKVYQP